MNRYAHTNWWQKPKKSTWHHNRKWRIVRGSLCRRIIRKHPWLHELSVHQQFTGQILNNEKGVAISRNSLIFSLLSGASGWAWIQEDETNRNL